MGKRVLGGNCSPIQFPPSRYLTRFSCLTLPFCREPTDQDPIIVSLGWAVWFALYLYLFIWYFSYTVDKFGIKNLLIFLWFWHVANFLFGSCSKLSKNCLWVISEQERRKIPLSNFQRSSKSYTVKNRKEFRELFIPNESDVLFVDFAKTINPYFFLEHLGQYLTGILWKKFLLYLCLYVGVDMCVRVFRVRIFFENFRFWDFFRFFEILRFF